MNYKIQYQQYLNCFENYLVEVFNSLDKTTPKVLQDSMKYAVLDGGKRIRPVLCMAVADILNIPFDDIKEFCVALECIHSYSLVHDDLPAMDNDDYRRGKLSTHKKFGEANGILTGDALLNFAFELCLSKDNFDKKCVKALKILSNYSGYNGMIAGQVLDLYENKSLSEPLLYEIYEKKTAGLLIAPLLIASTIGGEKYFDEFKSFGYHLGVLFQITDDILDIEGSLETIGKSPNKDDKANKLTIIKFYGLEGAKKIAKEHYKRCIEYLSNIPNNEFLTCLTEKVLTRKH